MIFGWYSGYLEGGLFLSHFVVWLVGILFLIKISNLQGVEPFTNKAPRAKQNRPQTCQTQHRSSTETADKQRTSCKTNQTTPKPENKNLTPLTLCREAATNLESPSFVEL